MEKKWAIDVDEMEAQRLTTVSKGIRPLLVHDALSGSLMVWAYFLATEFNRLHAKMVDILHMVETSFQQRHRFKARCVSRLRYI